MIVGGLQIPFLCINCEEEEKQIWVRLTMRGSGCLQVLNNVQVYPFFDYTYEFCCKLKGKKEDLLILNGQFIGCTVAFRRDFVYDCGMEPSKYGMYANMIMNLLESRKIEERPYVGPMTRSNL